MEAMNSRTAGGARAVDDRIADRWYEAVTASVRPPAAPTPRLAGSGAGLARAAARPSPPMSAAEAALEETVGVLAYPGLDPAGGTLRAELGDLAEALLGAVAADPVDWEAGRVVGARLARIGFGDAEDLARSVEVLGPSLAAAAGPDRARTAFVLLGAVASGHGDAVRSQALAAAAEEFRAELTALRQAERARRIGEARFRAVFEHAGVGALVVADSGAILEANDTARQITGRDLSRLSIGDVWDVVDPRDRAELIDMWAATRAGRPGHGVWRLIRPAGPDDGPVWVSLTASMVEDATTFGGVYFAVTIEDVTARRAALAQALDGAAPAGAAGPGRPAFEAEREAAARAALARTIEAALRADQFVVHYQPIVRLLDRRIVGAEALVRWEHPRYGLVGPEQFIGVAEESGLIVPLGLHVLETACRDAIRWMGAEEPPDSDDSDLPPFVSVNISVRQLDEPDIVPAILGILERTGLDPRRLQLELVESLLVVSAGPPVAALRALAAAGIRIALDDFGTGYSNFAYLHTLPVGALKLAGQFCGLGEAIGLAPASGEPDSSEQAAGQLVEGVVSIAHSLGHTVTVEAVETPEQAARMLQLGADLGQGHLFGRPMCADKLTANYAVGAAGPHGSLAGPSTGLAAIPAEALAAGTAGPAVPAARHAHSGRASTRS
jgi:PAS domain S-box-containing protein